MKFFQLAPSLGRLGDVHLKFAAAFLAKTGQNHQQSRQAATIDRQSSNQGEQHVSQQPGELSPRCFFGAVFGKEDVQGLLKIKQLCNLIVRIERTSFFSIVKAGRRQSCI